MSLSVFSIKKDIEIKGNESVTKLIAKGPSPCPFLSQGFGYLIKCLTEYLGTQKDYYINTGAYQFPVLLKEG